MHSKQKKAWISPEVRKFGSFEEATQACDKDFGSSDGFTFQGTDVVCAS